MNVQRAWTIRARIIGTLVIVIMTVSLSQAAPPGKKPPQLPQPTLLQTVKGRDYWVAIRFSPDASALTAASLGGTISAIDVATGKLRQVGSLRVFGHSSLCTVTPDASRAVSLADGQLTVFDIPAARVVLDKRIAELKDLPWEPSLVASGDGKFVSVGPSTGRSGRAVVVNLETGLVAGIHGPLLANLVFLENGRLVARRDAPRMEGGPTAWTLVELASGRAVGVINQAGVLKSSGKGTAFVGLEAATQFQGTRLADGSTLGKNVVKSWIGIWDASGRPKARWNTGEQSNSSGDPYFWAMQLSRDVLLAADDRLVMQLVAGDNNDSGVFFWDASQGKLIGKLPLKIFPDFVTTLTVADDGTRLALAINTSARMVGGRLETEKRTTQIGPDASVETSSRVRVGGDIVGGGARVEIYDLKPLLDLLKPVRRR